MDGAACGSERAEAAFNDIKATNASANIVSIPCDLANLDSIRGAAEEIKKIFDKVNVIVCDYMCGCVCE